MDRAPARLPMQPVGPLSAEALRALLATSGAGLPAAPATESAPPSAFHDARPDSAAFSAEALARLADEGGT